MTVGMAIDILEHADMSVFVDAGGAVQCRPDQLQDPDCPVYFLKEVPQEITVRGVQSNVHCKTLELPLNFHQVMIRYQFMTPPKGPGSRPEWLQKCRRYIKLWIELIVTEKGRQMESPTEMWPPLPWEATTVWDMPIVLWLSKLDDRNRRHHGRQ